MCAWFGLADPGDGTNDEGVPEAALQQLGSCVIRPATAKYEVFAITVNGKNTIGVVDR